MASMTKGSVLYAIDPADQTLMVLDKITSLDLGNATATTTDIQTWGDSTTKPVKTGFDLADAQLTLYPDPSNATHQRLYELANSLDTDGPVIQFALGWSDGTEPAAVGTGTDPFELPTTRTFFTFAGWIASFPLDFTGDVAETQMTIKRTDLGQWQPKAAA